MANKEHLAILRHGVEAWNQWRRQNSDVHPDLSGARLARGNLSGVNLSDANLNGVRLSGANLIRAYLYRAPLVGARLSGAYLNGVHLDGARLSGANLRRAHLWHAHLSGANLRGARLEQAHLSKARLWHADLKEADLREADLREADFSDANLNGVRLSGANLSGANFSGAHLRQADLTGALLLETNFEGADLTGCFVYGIAAWKVRLEGTTQLNLVITPEDEPKITVDNLEVAQFLYLLLENKKIRDIIGTVTSKAVLILGRFTKTQKPVLEAVHSALRDNHDLVPILFDFEPSPKRDLTETIQLLANLCRFVVADVTDAKSIPQELSHIIPYMPSVPVQPIILAAQTAYAMFEHWREFNSVLPEFLYRDQRHLLDNLQACVIKPVERWEAEGKKAAAKERLLQERIENLEAENAKLRGLQSTRPDTSG